MEPRTGTAHPKPILPGPSPLEAQKPVTLPSLIKTPKSFDPCKYIITRPSEANFWLPKPTQIPKTWGLYIATQNNDIYKLQRCKICVCWHFKNLKTMSKKNSLYQCSLSHLMPSAFSLRINFQFSDFDTLYNNYLTANSTTLRQSVIWSVCSNFAVHREIWSVSQINKKVKTTST